MVPRREASYTTVRLEPSSPSAKQGPDKPRQRLRRRTYEPEARKDAPPVSMNVKRPANCDTHEYKPYKHCDRGK